MAFTSYKSIADVLRNFPLNYQEEDFVEVLKLASADRFISRLNTIVRDGIVFNSEYAICENIISPILTEVWLAHSQNLLLWSHQPLNYDENLSGVPDCTLHAHNLRLYTIIYKYFCRSTYTMT